MSTRYSFGEYTLDLDRGALLRGGADVRLRPKSFEVLRLLIQRHGQLVTKEDLLSAVWEPAVVSDGAIGQCLIDVRRAIGDESQHIIRTVPRRGYIFDVAVVESHGSASANAETPPAQMERSASAPPSIDTQRSVAEGLPAYASPSSRISPAYRALLAVVLVAFATAGIWWALAMRDEGAVAQLEPEPAKVLQNSIAVLPFVNMSPEPDQEYFSDGISEEILNLLAQARGLQVIARTSSFSFKGQNADVAQIADRLNVAYVLEGSVRKTGDRVRITAQLIDAADSTHMWSSTYDRTLDDILAVQSDIAGAVAAALQAELLAQTTMQRTPASAAAYERYLQGQFFYGRRSAGDMTRAARYYEEALEIDPGYARAWAGIAAVTYIRTLDGELPRKTGMEQMRVAAEKAVALDPQLPEAHYRLAGYYWLSGDSARGRKHWTRAAELAPNNPLILGSRAGAAADEGNFDESIEMWRRVVALDPFSANHRNNLGADLYAAGRLEEAHVELLKALDLNPEGDRLTVACILLLRRDLDAAAAWLEQMGAGPDRDQGTAMLHHARGLTAESDAALARLVKSSGVSDPFRIAEVHAYRGNVEESFAWLRVFIDAGDAPENSRPARRKHAWEMRFSPFLRPLHGDPRWQPLLADAQARS